MCMRTPVKTVCDVLLVESDEQTRDFAARLVHGLSAKFDMLFTFDPEDQSACYFGAIESPDVLESFFPKAVRIG